MKNSLITLSEDSFIIKHTKQFMSIIIIISLLICGLYLNRRWNEHQHTETQVAVMLAESLGSQLDPQDISALSGSQEDTNKTEYVSIKRNLSKLVEETNIIYFAYLFGEQDGNMIFLADSEPSDSPDYSPPGQIYHEASDIDWKPFRSGITVMTEESTDRWGTWRSALVPITNPESGEVMAVLGLDFSASMWNARLKQQMIPEVIIAFLFMLLIIALSRALYLYSKLKVLSDRKARDEALYHSVFEQVPIGIAIVNDNTIRNWKCKYESNV